MKCEINWQEGMRFNTQVDNHQFLMDAKSPIGKGSAPTPKEMVAAGIIGCTAMDVIALLKKYKQLPSKFDVGIDVQTSTGQQPAVFTSAMIHYKVEGSVEPEKLKEAVVLSQTKYCGVSAMLSKAFPIEYKIELNSEIIGTGKADFSV